MKKYIKIDDDNNIVKVFYDFDQPQEMDGTEIFLEETVGWESTVNGKEIFDSEGFPLFWYESETVIEKTSAQKDSEPTYVALYKIKKKDELNTYIGTHLLDVLNFHTLDQIVTAWNNFKTNSTSWTTKQDVDTAFTIAINWLNS